MTDQFPGMLRSRQADATLARLPTELVDRLTRPFAQFLRVEAASGALLLLSTVAAIGLGCLGDRGCSTIGLVVF